MNWKRTSFPYLSSILLCLTLVTACGGGETKQAQCQKIGEIINGLGSVNPSDPGVMAELGLTAAKDLDALELSDKKLSNLRSQLSKSLKAASESTSKLVDSPESQAILEQIDKDSTEFQSKIKETQAYCKG